MKKFKEIIKLSVHDLIDFSLLSGDLGTGFFSASRAVEGTRGHQAVRKAILSTLPEDTSYSAEVPVTFIAEGKHTILEISGRIDGVIESPSGTVIHEIKTTQIHPDLIEIDHNPHHWSQAKCYAYMYSFRHKLNRLEIKLTYYCLENRTGKSFTEEYDFNRLEEFFLPLSESFLEWQDILNEWRDLRDNSIGKLSFPYPFFRKEQGKFMDSVSNCIRTGSLLFAQAPTGTGKTIAALYPAVKSLGEGSVSRIFYLTAKTTTRAIAEKALNDMRQKGLRLKSVTITAKEKICFNDVFSCDAASCKYAVNYYGKVKNAVKDAFVYERLDGNLIGNIAVRHEVCPFELSLDLSLWCDAIICDYNYLFDPRVYLKRFFMNRKGDYCFLVDEAHNLVDRARDMYSAEIGKRQVLELKRAAKAELPELYVYVEELYRHLLQISKELDNGNEETGHTQIQVRKEPPLELGKLASRLTEYAEKLLSKGLPVTFLEQFLEIYFTLVSFTKLLEFYDDRYVTYYEKTSRDLKIKLFCLDPSRLLKEAMNKGKASILFSATLSPVEYFARMLGGDETAGTIVLPSPFLKENLCVFIDDTVTTRYKSRYLTYDTIAESILAAVSCKTGNYMVFFPSFEYLREVYFRFQGIQTGIRTLYQTPGMSEAARQEFLDEFEYPGETSLVGFAVLGGVFGEGIDLAGDRLSGAIIVGVGLPLLSNEKNIIRQYFDEQACCGFEYAYLYPGMNRVLQAAGRVIRSETDRGVIVLLDERYANHAYRDLLPPEWSPVLRASDGCKLEEVLQDFWSEG